LEPRQDLYSESVKVFEIPPIICASRASTHYAVFPADGSSLRTTSTLKHQSPSGSGATGQAINRPPSASVLSRLLAQRKTWNALPRDVTWSQSEYVFYRQLMTWLLEKSFADNII